MSASTTKHLLGNILTPSKLSVARSFLTACLTGLFVFVSTSSGISVHSFEFACPAFDAGKSSEGVCAYLNNIITQSEILFRILVASTCIVIFYILLFVGEMSFAFLFRRSAAEVHKNLARELNDISPSIFDSYKSNQEPEQIVEALREITRLLSRSLTKDEVISGGSAVQCSIAYVAPDDEHHLAYQITAVAGQNAACEKKFRTDRSTQQSYGVVAYKSGHTVVGQRSKRDSRYAENDKEAIVSRSFLCIPLIPNGESKPLGVLAIDSQKMRAFKNEPDYRDFYWKQFGLTSRIISDYLVDLSAKNLILKQGN